MRDLRYVIVELGSCGNCGKDAGEHTLEGICRPMSERPVSAKLPRPCYRGDRVYAFVDLAEPEATSIATHRRAEVIDAA